MTNPPSKKQLREFGYLLGLGFPIILGWFIPFLLGHHFRAWTLWIGVPGLILALFAPLLLFWPYRLWMGLGHALGWVNSHLILGLVFIVVLQPIAFFMRMLGHDPLKRKRHSGPESYREIREHSHIDLKRIF
jgi:hypothetical protein